MTIADLLNQNFFIVWIILGLLFFLSVFLPIITIIKRGRIKIFDWIVFDIRKENKIGTSKEQKAALSRLIKKNIPNTNFINDEKIQEIIKKVPEQTIAMLYLRVSIERLMFVISVSQGGLSMGLGYPGWRYYNSFTYVELIDQLPTRYDLRSAPDIKETILDFYSASSPCINLEELPELEYNRLLISGMYIEDQLLKLKKNLENSDASGNPKDYYFVSDLYDNSISKKKHK